MPGGEFNGTGKHPRIAAMAGGGVAVLGFRP
jgi:hypothetical protein